MKVVILAGGLGTRLGEETSIYPKPMVCIGGHPIIWHIMKIYSHYGFNDFLILTGYKQEVIKDYFINYCMNNSDITVNLRSNEVKIHRNRCESWNVTLCYTGYNTLTGGRIKKVENFINKEPFLLTYGDGVSDVNILDLINFHNSSGKLCTLTAVQPEGRFGVFSVEKDSSVVNFQEKPKNEDSWINGGFFVCEPGVLDYIPEGDDIAWEQIPLKKLVEDNQLNAYRHYGFWRPMDMLKDKKDLNDLWASGNAPWKIWQDKVWEQKLKAI